MTVHLTEEKVEKLSSPKLLLALASLALWGSQIYIFHDFIVPPGHDAIWHAETILRILSDGAQIDFYRGFHLIIAFLYRISKLFIDIEIHQVMLYATILISPVVIIGVFLLFRGYFQDERSALWSALGCLSFFPLILFMHYWSMFPLLWALFFLPVVMYFNLAFFEKTSIKNGLLSLFSILFLFLIHPVGLVNFFIYQVLLLISLRHRVQSSSTAKTFRTMLIASSLLVAVMIFLSKDYMVAVVSEAVAKDFKHDEIWPLGFPGWYFRYILLALFGAGLNGIVFVVFFSFILLMMRKNTERSQWFFPLLSLLIYGFIFVDSQFLQLLYPAYYFLFPWGEEFRVPSYTFIIGAAVFGYTIPILWKNRYLKRYIILAGFLSVIFVLVVFPYFVRDPFHGYSPVGRNDAVVFEWIKKNTPPDAVILNDHTLRKENFLSWNRPSDGGAWIPLMTERKILFPYFVTLDLQTFKERLYVLEHILDIDKDERTQSLVRKFNVKYVFCGSQNYNLYEQTMDPKRLLSSSAFQLVLKADTGRGKPAYIFKIL